MGYIHCIYGLYSRPHSWQIWVIFMATFMADMGYIHGHVHGTYGLYSWPHSWQIRVIFMANTGYIHGHILDRYGLYSWPHSWKIWGIFMATFIVIFTATFMGYIHGHIHGLYSWPYSWVIFMAIFMGYIHGHIHGLYSWPHSWQIWVVFKATSMADHVAKHNIAYSTTVTNIEHTSEFKLTKDLDLIFKLQGYYEYCTLLPTK